MPSFEMPPTGASQPTQEKPQQEQARVSEVVVVSPDLQMLSPEKEREPGKRYIDEDWFPEYSQIMKETPPTLATLNGNIQVAKAERKKLEESYAKGTPEEPLFSYDNVDLGKYKETARRYYALKERVRAEALTKKPEEMSPEEHRKAIAARLYVAAINEQIATMNMMAAVREADLEKDPKRKENKLNRVQRYMDFIYGKPEPEIFLYAVDQIRNEIALERDTNKDPDMLKACDELEAYLSQFPQNEFDPVVKPGKTREIQTLVRRDLENIYGMTLTYDQAKVFSTAEVVSTLNMAAKRLDANWSAYEDASTSGIAVDPPREGIMVKPGKTLVGKEMQEKVIHEINYHARRSINGAKTDLKILSFGLDRNSEVEEGGALIDEALLYSTEGKTAGLNQYLCVGLATGFAPDQTRVKSGPGAKEKIWAMEPKKFSEVYDFCIKYGRFARLKNKMPKEKLEENLREGAWTTARRVFRGFDGQTPGFAHTRDLVYTTGPIKTWFVLNESKNIVNTYKLMKMGKFDITNQRHVEGLRALGLYVLEEKTLPSDEDLAFLASTHEYEPWSET